MAKRSKSTRQEFKSADQMKAEELGIDYQLWKPGVYSFKCPAHGCLFDSVEMGILLTHIDKVHTVQEQPTTSRIIHVDKYGNPQPGPAGSGGSR